MSKYQPLTEHLKKLPLTSYPITFKDIEDIIDTSLPASAYQYRAWWSNNPSNSVMTKAWLDAGWISSDVDLEGQKLVFRRRRESQPSPPPVSPQSNRPDPTASLSIEGLAPATLAALEDRASLSGQSLAETARAVLEKHARITVAERLALADSLRARSPKLHHIDVPSIIRAERDSR